MTTEIEFESAVVDVAHVFGWRAVGHRPMRTKHGWATGWKYDGVGWPDLTLVNSDRGILIAAELKTATGRLSDDQQLWQHTLETLAANSEHRIRYHVWRPADWNDIVHTLSAGTAT